MTRLTRDRGIFVDEKKTYFFTLLFWTIFLELMYQVKRKEIAVVLVQIENYLMFAQWSWLDSDGW